ncbi:Uncharacterised protein [Vibrio cholerae]|nr:Uncharacterised protein [Vibrio cholerae]CSB84439.1 Uncharacterised protein [Vibrio cholerae]
MVLIEGAALRIHRFVFLPCFWDHHHQSVRQAATGKHQQFEYHVKVSRIGCAFLADRQQHIDFSLSKQLGL